MRPTSFAAFAFLSLSAAFAAPDARAGGPAANPAGPVAEIVTFRLVPGVTDDAFLDAARATEAAVAAQPGFLRRTLSRDETGLWTDHVEWASLEQALAAAEAVTQLPEFGPFAGAIDLSGLTIRHAPILWRMGG
jgi:hypothetical protein